MRRVVALAVAILLSLVTVSVFTQTSALSVVSAGPRDELTELADAGEIRVVFSDPMVALGDAAVTGTPPWITIAPAARGAFYWSGTRTLIFTPEPSLPLPMATRFTVRIETTARSVSGRVLTAPYTFSFVTPTVRLLSANWYRKNTRADSPVVVELRFNQPVRANDVAAHTQLRPVSHPWTAPTLAAAVRSRLSQTDPSGLARFDAKVAATARIARGSGEPIGVTPAAAWDEQRFPPAPTAVVLETTTVPPPESWLAVTIDSRLPSLQGPETHGEQSTTIQIERAFFVNGLPCASGCDPSGYGGLNFTRPLSAAAFTRALSVRDITDPRAEKPIAAANAPANRASTGFTIQDAGFSRQPPDSTWLMAIDSSLTAADGQTLGYPWMGIVENIHEQAFLGIGGSVWEAGAGPTIPLVTRNVTSARYWPAPVTPGALLSLLQSFSRMGAAQAPNVEGRTLAMTATPDAVEAHGMDLRNVLSPGGTGLVWAGMNLDDTIARVFWPTNNVNRMQSTVVQVTNLGVGVKDSPESTLVFVTRLDNGAPVPQAAITITDKSNRPVWRGSTDRDGVAMAPALTLRRNDSPPYAPPPLFIVTAEKDGDVAYVGSDWSGSIQPYSWGLSYQPDEAAEILRGSIFSDRGVYRQGEEAHVKAVLRIDAPSGVRLVPSDTSFDVTVRDPRGRDVDKRRVVVNALSSVEWTWTIPAEGALGRYAIDLRAVDAPANARYRQASGSLLVAQYRRPDFRVDAALAAAPAVAGQTLHGTVDAKYLFGAGVAAQPVRWRLTRTATSNVPSAIRQRFPEERYAFGYLAPPPPNASSVIQVATRTEPLDAGGHLAVDALAEAEVDAAYAYSFEGDVESAGGQHIANRAALVVHPAPFYVGVRRLPFFVDTKTGAAIDIVAAAIDGQTMAGVPVTVALVRQEWQWSALPGGRGGSSNWERKEIAAGEWTVTTSDRSAMPLQIPVSEGGSYLLRATARDASGHRTRTDVSFYAVGSGQSSWKVDGNRIDLVPERKTWKPGESARILIQSPWDRATGLLTVEREGIRSHRRFDVASTQDTIEVPITEADVPNVYVSVMLVKGRTADALGPDGSDLGKPSYRVGYTELTVDDASKHLDVSVTTDAAEYRPKQQVKVDVSVGPPRGRAGATEVTLWAMDYGLLSLTDYRTPDVVKAIYAHKSLGVMTEDNRERLISRRVLAKDRTASEQTFRSAAENLYVTDGLTVLSQSGAGGGRGGAGIGGGIPAPAAPAQAPPRPGFQDPALEVRSEFRSLVFWMGSVPVGADGRATTTVTLPDSLTTYRIMAVAADAASHFGWAEREVKVTKPLTLLPEFPRFMARGDRAAFGAIVTNSSPSGGDAIVTIRSLDPTVLAFGAADRQTLRLAQGATLPVHFDATARGSGSARVQMTVTLGGETDAFETSLPVTVPARLETVAAYGDTTTRALEKVVLPAGIVPDIGGLRVELSSTALVGLGESARYLDEYPYECAEQRTSRALALLLTSDLGGAFSLANATPAESRTRASALFEELYSYQCGDGGFALWPGMCQSTSAYLTAYVLHAFKVAGTLNVTIDQNAINRGLNYLQNQLRQPPPEVQWWPAWAASQAYAVKVLAEFNRNPSADITRLYGMAERLPVFAMSYLADALAATGDRGGRYGSVVQRMTNALRIDADRAHIEEIDDASLVWLWNTNVRATAVVLDGLARRKDDATFVAPLVRWLVGAQKNGRWGTTHENAMALEALVAYYRTYETDVPDMTATVTLGARTLGSPAFKGRSTVAQSVDLPMAEVVREVARTTTSDLVVSRAGTGRVFYTSRLRYLAPEPPSMVDRGMRVERRYERANAAAGASAGTDFSPDDLIRVTLTINLPREGRYIALTDPMPAGFEPVDANLKTTASDLAAQSSISNSNGGSNWLTWWRRGGFDHVEKHDDRVVAFATRLAAGRHEFSYLVRATTAGTFTAAGAQAEEMYAPEVKGRSAASVIQIR